jgi:oligopeptide/dipeptide ABC transporter ATP-binding protein
MDGADRKLEAIPGIVPENYQDIVGCRFAGRCPYREEGCEKAQELVSVEAGHLARCHLAKQLQMQLRTGEEQMR